MNTDEPKLKSCFASRVSVSGFRPSGIKVAEFAPRRVVPGALLRRAAKNDVIEHVDFQQLPGSNQIASHFDIRFTRRWIAARMIVDDDERRGIGRYRGAEDFARMNENRIERSLGKLFDADEPAARIQKYGLKSFHGEQSHGLAQVIGHALG